jgi:UDP-2,3-diacylglucosamine pyrophosphatase LpxH
MDVQAQYDYRTVFISDLHVGWDKVSEDHLLSFLRRLKTRNLYLVGDVLEWFYRPSGTVRMSIKRFLQELLELSQRGTVIHWLSGNHDPATYKGPIGLDWLYNAIPEVRVKPHDRYTASDGRTYLIVHGDIYDYFTPKTIAWKQRLAEWLYPLYLRILDRSNRCGWIGAIQKRKNQDPLLADHANAFRNLMIELARLQNCDGVICGHIHVPESCTIGSMSYLNCGDWLEHRSYLAETESGQIKLMSQGSNP